MEGQLPPEFLVYIAEGCWGAAHLLRDTRGMLLLLHAPYCCDFKSIWYLRTVPPSTFTSMQLAQSGGLGTLEELDEGGLPEGSSSNQLDRTAIFVCGTLQNVLLLASLPFPSSFLPRRVDGFLKRLQNSTMRDTEAQMVVHQDPDLI